MGIIKAQLAAKTNGNVIVNTSKLLLIANILNIGNKRNVVAVLLVNSVIKEVIKAINMITKNILKDFIMFRLSEISFASPEETIKLAIDNPPPKRIKIFQGIFANQFESNIDSFFLNGIIKKRNEPKIAIAGSVKFILNISLILFLKIQRLKVTSKINIVVFSL